MPQDFFDTPIEFFKGVGPKIFRSFASYNILKQ
jgi:hypothetical protein